MSFDIDQFYNYYSNTSNLQFDPSQPIYKYNHMGKTKFTQKTGYYIVINNRKIYVEPVNHSIREILFTIHDPTDPDNWDNHFHFGIRNGIENKPKNIFKTTNIIFFHKTEQISKNKKPINCYFRMNENIMDIENIDCLETTNRKMKDKFKIGSEDLKIIKKIIKMPFGIPGGKKRNKTKRNKFNKRKTIRKI